MDKMEIKQQKNTQSDKAKLQTKVRATLTKDNKKEFMYL
jgi:hypothetical protein